MKKVSFDPTISMGHIIQAATVILGIMIGILRYEYKVQRLEELTAQMNKTQETQAQAVQSLDKAITKLTWIVDNSMIRK